MREIVNARLYVAFEVMIDAIKTLIIYFYICLQIERIRSNKRITFPLSSIFNEHLNFI